MREEDDGNLGDDEEDVDGEVEVDSPLDGCAVVVLLLRAVQADRQEFARRSFGSCVVEDLVDFDEGVLCAKTG